jgi:hypothetical protein
MPGSFLNDSPILSLFPLPRREYSFFSSPIKSTFNSPPALCSPLPMRTSIGRGAGGEAFVFSFVSEERIAHLSNDPTIDYLTIDYPTTKLSDYPANAV